MRGAHMMLLGTAPAGGGGSTVTLDPANKGASITLSNGDLTATNGSSTYAGVRATSSASTGKFYSEYTMGTVGGTNFAGVGVWHSSDWTPTPHGAAGIPGRNNAGASPGYGYEGRGYNVHTGSFSSNSTPYTIGDVLGVAVDLDNGRIWFRKNGAWVGGGDPAAGTSPAYTGLSGTYYPGLGLFNSTASITANFGATPYAHAAPSGFGNWP